MKAILIAAAASLLVAGCATSEEEDYGGPPPMAEPMGMPAPEYVENAASGDQFEIQSSELALQRSCDPYVRNFAQMLITDHSRMSREMMTAAQDANVPPPPSGLAPRHQDMLARLEAAAPGGFDTEFRSTQLMAHEEALGLHRDYSEDGDVAALRAVAAQAVPAIQAHLERARTLPTTTTCNGSAEEEQRKRGQRG